MPLVFDVDSGEQVLLLVTVSDYRRLTGDQTTAEPAVQDALLNAQELIEEWLRRGLPQIERTETLRLYHSDGYAPTNILGVSRFSCAKVYPSATPLISTDSGTISQTAIVIDETADPSWLTSWQVIKEVADVTYVGGFTEETLPRTLQIAIARTAKELIDDATVNTDIPDDVASVAVGDVRVTYRGTNTKVGLSQDVKDSIKRYRREDV